MALLICLKGEAFYTSSQVSFALGPQVTGLWLPAHSGTLLVGAGGLVVRVTLPETMELRDLPQEARFEHLRRLLVHLVGLYLEARDAAPADALGKAYGVLICEAVRADLARTQLNQDLGREQVSTRFSQAREYIRAHLFERIRLSDLARVLKVSPRTVQLIFAQEAGQSLTRYVTRMRLEEAHQRLLQADPQINVTQIALDCGFNHAGLFSAAYRRAFGELPRDTLARARKGASGEKGPESLPIAS